jgi:hypothetical protein
MNPLPNVEKFIVSTLLNNGAVAALVGNRVYSGKPPDKPTSGNTVIFPCVVFTFYSGIGVTALCDTDNRVLELPVYTVKAVTQAEDYGGAHEIANAIDEVLKAARGPVTYAGRTVQLQGLRKHEWIAYQEPDEAGRRINHVGANYRAFVSGV